MAKRSVYFGAPIDTLLNLVGSDNVSGALNSAVNRYLAIMDDHRPKFSRAEWCAICDMLNGTMMDDEMWMRRGGRLLAMEMQDSEPDGLYEKWEIDGPALAEKLAALDTAAALSVMHVATVFWAHSDMDTDEALALAGIKF